MSHTAVRGNRLTVYTSENVAYEGKPLFEWLLHRGLEAKLKGATAVRGMAGFGRDLKLRHSHVVDLASELPILVEFIDTEDNIRAFIDDNAEALRKFTFTIEETWWFRPNA